MQLNSFAFFGFFAVIFILYWLAAPHWRVPLLFCASMGFYALFGLGTTVLLLVCMLLCWAGGLWVAQKPTRARLALAVTLALLPLLAFKYLALFWQGAGALATLLGGSLPAFRLSWVQPVGISYYTFQMISYLVDIYRGKASPQKNFLVCAVTLSLFLQITAGPLTRPRTLAPQLLAPRPAFDTAKAVGAAQLLLLGLFKKIVLADALAYYTAQVFADPTRLYGLSLILNAVFYAVQIYADFSGYTDLARGFGGLLELELAENFRAPYLSRSVREFWRRWHISLSSWLAEYIYIPLGGSRVSRPRHYFNLFFTFLLSGLWHGASVTMLVWGALHGGYVVAGTATRGLRQALYQKLHIGIDSLPARIWQTLCTFALVCFGWVFFSAPNLTTAWYIVTHLFTGFVPTLNHVKESVVLLGLSAEGALRFGILFAALLAIDFATKDSSWPAFLAARRRPVQLIICWLLAAGIIFWGTLGGGSFMYFQF